MAQNVVCPEDVYLVGETTCHVVQVGEVTRAADPL